MRNLVLIFTLSVIHALCLASTSSVYLQLPTTSVQHSDIKWTAGTNRAAATSVSCLSGQAVSDATQSISWITHRYVKEINESANGTPIGWNYNGTGTKNRPSYGIDCKALNTNLVFVPGRLP